MRNDVAFNRKLMLLSAIILCAILVATTFLVLSTFSSSNKWLIVYIVAVPIFFTVLSFVLSYIDIEENTDEDEVEYYRKRGFIFGGVMFALTLVAELLFFLRNNQ